MQETGKQRKSRIPPDYFTRSDPLTRWKVRLTIGAVAITAAWWAGGWLRGGDVGRARYSRGPLANVHATWELRCTACHVPWTPIDSNNWLAADSGGTMVSDQLCRDCHAGPSHHERESPAHTPSCAHCHREHRGREASLLRMSSTECVRCHYDLRKHTRDGHTEFERRVTEFHIDHPEFKAREKQEPGKLHFSHARHLAEGMPLVKSDGTPSADAVRIWKYADIRNESDRLRYWKQRHADATTIPPDQLDSPVQLDCAACHRLESADFGISAPRRHTSGLHSTAESTKYMLPITYENHCQACHPLGFEETAESTETVPHGIQVADVRRILEGVFVDRFLAGRAPPAPSPQPLSSRPMPGRTVGEEPQRAQVFIDKQIQDAETYLFGTAGCKRCHGDPDKPLESIELTGVPDVWLAHAIFDHAAHRALDCEACHVGVKQSTSERDVLLPGIEICRECHAPATRSGTVAKGGARFDCTECHRYHNGDFPQQGIGSAARDAAKTFKAPSEFLNGKLPGEGKSSSP